MSPIGRYAHLSRQDRPIGARKPSRSSPAITRRLLDRVARRLPPAGGGAGAAATQPLTEREREILQLVAAGMSNAEVARALVVAEPTVRTHVSNLLGKLGLRDRVQAVIYAYEHGLAQPRSGA